jgi:succinoglycan biosynthesis transport protein ExoP
MSLILPSAGAPASSINIKSIIRISVAHWKMIVTVLMTAFLGTYCLLLVVPRVYKSTVEILIFDPEQQIDQEIQKSVTPFRENLDTVAMNTEIAVIKSKSMALRVVEKLGLDNQEDFRSRNPILAWIEGLGLTKASDSMPEDAEQTKALRLDRAADLVRTQLEAERLQFSYILAISATARSPAMAQSLAAAVADDYLSSQHEAREDTLQRVMTWLKSRTEDLQSRIQEEETSIEKLKAANGLSDVAGRGNITDQQISDLNAQLMVARGEVTEKRAHVEQANRVLATKGDLQEIPEVMTSSAITQLRLQASQLSWQETKLRNELGPNHEAVIAVHNQLAGVNSTISGEAARVIGDLKAAYDTAVQREHSLELSLQSLANERGDSGEFLRLQELQRAVSADRQLYESYLSQFNELSKMGSVQAESARIISAATLPGAPSSPRRLVYYGFGGSLGLTLGFALAFLPAYFRRGLRTGREVEHALGYPVLGAIPLMRSDNWSNGSQTTSLVQRMVDAPRSEFGEAVRTTRLGLQLLDPEKNPKVVLITSSIPGEGKSAAAMLLAASSAQSGQRTVLVDCDLRRHTLSDAFGMPRRGLGDLLSGTADIAEVTIQDPATGVCVIPTGTVTSNTTDLLASQQMRDLIAKLRHHYDYVVIDASPVLPVIDALALATLADKVLVIVEWDRTPRDTVFEAFNILRPEAHRIAGIVLNKVDPQCLSGYGYGY